jgi:hypothetical protein
MNKKQATIIIVLIITIFIGFIVFDVAFKGEGTEKASAPKEDTAAPDMWEVTRVFEPGQGKLKAVAVMQNGNIVLGGDSFAACFDSEYLLKWNVKTENPVTALAECGDTVYASTQENILVIDQKGKIINEWGPFEDKAIITSVACNGSYVAFADAGNKIVFVLDKKGEVKYMTGQSGEPFVVPSPYFDVALGSDNTLYVANTGHRRIEMRNINGSLLGYFGEPGTAPGAFCGCCNPAHFALVPGGFVTAEKGINRIKLLNEKGEFTEFVSSVNDFVPPLPLDIASADGKTIYGANPADNKLYVFVRK